ncbi:MAG: hypothetical protein VX982_01545, partial [Chloroflexota bacterium]|nr:hypothetical protein [Chloroflexota bacterium]MED5449774.1 hypothetical protein [Chloroflexota bacterium]
MRFFYSITSRILKKKNLEDRFQNGNQNQALGSFLSFRTAAIFLVAFLAMYALFRFFQIDWDSVIDALRSLHIGNYIIALISYYLSFLFRGMRWKIIAHNAFE